MTNPAPTLVHPAPFKPNLVRIDDSLWVDPRCVVAVVQTHNNRAGVLTDAGKCLNADGTPDEVAAALGLKGVADA